MRESNPDTNIIFILRTLLKFSCIFGLCYALLSILISEQFNHSFILGIALSFVCGYLSTRFKIFHSMNEENIELKWKTKTISISTQLIQCITKNIRFTFSDEFLWILKTKSEGLKFPKFYIFPNVKGSNLESQFLSFGIRLKNIN